MAASSPMATRAPRSIVHGAETLPIDDFIAANRRNTLAGEAAPSQASKAP